ncbi:hypothetical protein OG302_26910 [Streptomyces sp. NBC_01283]|uniref:hypothetical protein n=1 Tax=Streptomyces sp. NBC_01283 TaxID=2903812 RepID=UPI00352C31E6|nr:hypothetical protein OG302_26910 [Streptomyces sp. NBC_01283]
MAGGNIKISPDEMHEASTWLQNQKELMQQSLHEASTKAIEGLQGVSEFIKQVADAFVDTDDQTANSVG